MQSPLFRAVGVGKAYASPVLESIDLSLAAGEVVALTGENGAGKSTLSKIIAGLVAPDCGELHLHGERYAPADRVAAERLGVRMVMQELSLIGTLSIAENLQLRRIPSRAGFIRSEALSRIAREQLVRVGLSNLDPALPTDELGIGQQQLVEIARGLMGDVRLLILDEPTAMLTAPETARLFEQIERLKSQGVAIIYITHRLDELSRIADRILILRDGVLVCDRPAREIQHEAIVRMMVGHDVVRAPDRPRRAAGIELLRTEGLSRGLRVRNVSLQLHSAEILGLAGLVGSGRTDLLRLLFGADPRDAGDIYLNGSSSPTEISSPVSAVSHGVGLLTEDRKAQGLLLAQSVAANITLTRLAAVSRRGWLDFTKERRVAERFAQRLRIRARDSDQQVGELSGGNQQKVLFARWLHRQCRILLLDEPTRGIDVGARADIHAELQSLAQSGKGLLVASSDLRELMELCDRIAVMSAGMLVKTFERDEWNEQVLLEAAFSAYSLGPAAAEPARLA